MPKINQEEYEVLKDYNYIGVKWVSRNENGNLVISKVKPDKIRGKWLPNCPDEDWSELRNSHNNLFHFIQSEDDEPYNIAELIEENESSLIKSTPWTPNPFDLESEETEVKDIEWLKNHVDESETTIKNLLDGATTHRTRISLNGSLATLKDFRGYVDQLDEPEVLSQELPSIPQIVAEWYESEGKRKSWWNWLYKWGRDENRTELESKTIGWMQDYNEEVFVSMFLHGYTVEKEQKYQVIIRDGEYMRLYLCKHDGNVTIGTNDNYIEKCPEVTYLTEQEIKDYDERYWPFAVKVKEMEE